MSDNRNIKLADHLANEWSKDHSTKVGAVIINDRTQEIVSTGVNGFPRGFHDYLLENPGDRDKKYMKVIHAEMNAILHLIGKAINPHDTYTLYVTHPICSDCAKHICQVSTLIGLKKIVFRRNRGEFSERWNESINAAIGLFEEAGLNVVQLKG